MSENTQSVVKKDVGTQVIERIEKLCEAGFVLPKGYNAVNAIKASMLKLQEVVDKNKRPALEVCTPVSIQTFLFEMAVKGLDVSKNQIYPIVRGNKLCGQVSYFGHILQVKRIFPDWSPIVRVVREGDKFVYTIDSATGKMKLVEHEQKLENIDKEFIGAYMYLPCADGEPELYVMTRKQILKAWSKSSNTSLQVHKDFDEKMIGKTLVNSGCTKVINTYPDTNAVPEEDEDFDETKKLAQSAESQEYTDFEEVPSEEVPNDEHPQDEQPQPTEEHVQEQPNDDEF